MSVLDDTPRSYSGALLAAIAVALLAGVGGLNGWTGWRRAADRPGRRLRTSRELFHAATKHTVLISGPAGWASPA